MADDTDQRAVDQFLDRADAALSEYEDGYADADATVSVLSRHIERLRTATDS